MHPSVFDLRYNGVHFVPSDVRLLLSRRTAPSLPFHGRLLNPTRSSPTSHCLPPLITHSLHPPSLTPSLSTAGGARSRVRWCNFYQFVFLICDFFRTSGFQAPPGAAFSENGQKIATQSGLRYAGWLQLALLLRMAVLRWHNGGI